MLIGSRNRQIQTTELCKEYLRQKYETELLFVEAFIIETEGTGTKRHGAHWGEFTDSSWKNEELLIRLGEHFEKWLEQGAEGGWMAPMMAHARELEVL